MSICSGGVLIPFKIQLDAKYPKLFPKTIGGSSCSELIPTEYLPHLRQITTHFKYKNLDKKPIIPRSLDRKKIPFISHVQ